MRLLQLWHGACKHRRKRPGSLPGRIRNPIWDDSVPPALSPSSRRATWLAGCALLASCAVGPDFKPPAPPPVARITANALPEAVTAQGETQAFRTGADVTGAWWTLFRNPTLTGLVATALAHNPSLEAARQTLRQGREAALAARGSWLPQIGASLNHTRNEISAAEGGLRGAGETFSIVTGQATVNYTFDIWGQTARTVEAADAQARAQQFQLLGAANMLAANTVVAAINTASLRAQLAAEQTLVTAERDLLRTVKRQFELGGATGTDVATQEAQLANTEALLVPLRTQLAQAGNQLAAYLGETPASVQIPEITLDALRLPAQVPVSLPSRLVAQRPDIMASAAQLQAASAQLGVAIANRLPQVTLSAFVGSAPSNITSLITPGNGVWSLANQVSMPLFQGGTLLHQQRAADAALQAAAANYQNTVITAFQNVADVLTALANDADAVTANADGARAAARALELARIQYSAGGLPYLSVLTAQTQYQTAVLGLVRARATRLADSAALFAALGGGWWNRHDLPPAPHGLIAAAFPALDGLAHGAPAAAPDVAPPAPAAPDRVSDASPAGAGGASARPAPNAGGMSATALPAAGGASANRSPGAGGTRKVQLP